MATITSERDVLLTSACSVAQAKKLTQKKHQLQGGYECIFVRAPPEVLQTECPVCLCVLREPYLLDCCGNSFCKTCIEPIKSDNKPCPLCNVQFTTSIPDKRLQRTLNELQVYCCHKVASCEWVGELGSLPQHLNLKPQDESHRLSGCQLVSISCAFCTLDIQRRVLKEHEEGECPQRPFNCEYCQKYQSTYKDVTTNHWPVCPSRPVPCPNECGASPKLGYLDDYIENECPLQLVNCTFMYAGCYERLPRKDMPEHISQSVALHMFLQSTCHQQELKKLNSEISELKTQLGAATVKLKELEAKNHLLQEKVDHVVPFSFIMPDFEQNKSSKSSWYSPSFYSHPRGYKMCLKVYANGVRDGENSHVSVYLFMMRGEYDESLKWPFRGDITILLLNQVRDGGHHTGVINVTYRADDAFCERVLSEERSPGGWGLAKFVCHSHLLPNFLKDDCLKLCIKEVKLKC